MALHNDDSAWKLILLVLVLVLFVCVGIAHVINPDWFIGRSGVRRGGEMLTEWNRLGTQVVGALIAGFAVCALFALLRDVLRRGSNVSSQPR